MYRILSQNGEIRDWFDQLRHMNHPRPGLLATKPDEPWRGDITKLKGPANWIYFYLCLVLDVFSRYAVVELSWFFEDRNSQLEGVLNMATKKMWESVRASEERDIGIRPNFDGKP
jgi:transposase InsO family protein